MEPTYTREEIHAAFVKWIEDFKRTPGKKAFDYHSADTETAAADCTNTLVNLMNNAHKEN